MKYFIRTNEAETGPLTEQEIIDRIKYGGLTADDLACPEGESGFKPISVLFSRFLEPTPPPFPSVSEAISPDVKAPSPQQRVSGQQGALLDTLSGWAKPPGNVQQANPVLLADLAVKKENVYFFFVALINVNSAIADRTVTPVTQDLDAQSWWMPRHQEIVRQVRMRSAMSSALNE